MDLSGVGWSISRPEADAKPTLLILDDGRRR